MRALPFGGKPRGATLRGVFPGVVPPQDGPPNLGIARDLLGVFLVAIVPSFTEFSDFLVQIILSHR